MSSLNTFHNIVHLYKPLSSFISKHYFTVKFQANYTKETFIKQKLSAQHNLTLINSACADGGPHSRVCAHLTLCSAPHRTSLIFWRTGLREGENYLINFLVISSDSKYFWFCFFKLKNRPQGGRGVTKKHKDKQTDKSTLIII